MYIRKHRRERWTYHAMKARCYNPKSTSYARYGAQGIRMCDRWLASFSNFLHDMGERPPGMTIDRINNDGDYTPDNCRWATPVRQNRNRSMFKRNTSGYRGVHFNNKRALKKQYQTMICADGKQLHLGWHYTAEEAALAYDAAAVQLHGEDARTNLL